MTIYVGFAFPFIISGLLYLMFKHKIVWWEIIIPIVTTFFFILICKLICVSSLTQDTEYWGGYVQQVRYWEDWNEEVPCRHEIPCSHPKYCEDDDGDKYECGTEHDNDGYYHPYDVDYHSEYWDAVTTLGTFNISQQRYDELLVKFEVKPIFQDQHRDYHDNDGDMYHGDYDQTDEKLEPVAVAHSYENRPQGSSGAYHYLEVDSFDIALYKPYEYPQIYNVFHQRVILGSNDQYAEQKLQVVNSRLGASRQIRVYFLIFNDQPSREAGMIQQRHWQNGNMNELVVCIGLNEEKEVAWSHVFSWTEQQEVMVNIRTHIEEKDEYNLREYIDFTEAEINQHWKRKDFKEFDYLTINPTSAQTMWVLLLALVINFGIAIWIVMNEFEQD